MLRKEYSQLLFQGFKLCPRERNWDSVNTYRGRARRREDAIVGVALVEGLAVVAGVPTDILE